MSDTPPPTRTFGRFSSSTSGGSLPVGVVVSLLLGLAGGGAGGTFLGGGRAEDAARAQSAKTDAALADLARKTDQVLLRLDSLDRRAEATDSRAAELAREVRDLLQRVTRIEERAAARENGAGR